METLTSDQSPTSSPETLLGIPTVISSPALADGQKRSVSRDGRHPVPSGLDHVRVSRFRSLDQEQAISIGDTFGLFFTGSLRSVNLQASLASSLRARMDVNGSPEYALTWKKQDMPAGPPICALLARARRTPDKGLIGWPTPMAGTPAQKGYNEAGNTDSSRKTVAVLKGWSTPDTNQRGGPQDPEKRKDGGHSITLQDAAQTLKGWSTPKASDAAGGRTTTTEGGGNVHLDKQVREYLRGWATPRARDYKGNGVSIARAAKGVADSLDLQCKLVCQNGTAPQSPFSARMARGGPQLNEEHSRWVMGYRPEWSAAAPSRPNRVQK